MRLNELPGLHLKTFPLFGSLTLRRADDLLRLLLRFGQDLLLLKLRLRQLCLYISSRGAHTLQILIRGGLRRIKHAVQRQRGLRNGAGVCDPELFVLQLGLRLRQLLLGLLLLLQQRVDDVKPLRAAQTTQFLICHAVFPSF